jgi:hypothetical protein
MLPIDHVTVAGADLRRMQAALVDLGIETVYGGAHHDGVTEMALVSFPDGSVGLERYLDPSESTKKPAGT